MADTVTVGLRAPFGLVIEHGGQKRLLNGWNQGANANTPNREGFGFTDGVPADLFAGWYADQMAAGTDLVRNDLVFANSDAAAARAQANERMNNVRSGMEGANPENPVPGERVKLEMSDETRRTLDENRNKP